MYSLTANKTHSSFLAVGLYNLSELDIMIISKDEGTKDERQPSRQRDRGPRGERNGFRPSGANRDQGSMQEVAPIMMTIIALAIPTILVFWSIRKENES